MRFMIIIKSNEQAEQGMPADPAAVTAMIGAMSKFNEEMADAGVMLAGEGLRESAKGKRVKIADGKTTIIDGPFTEAKELVAGFWLIQVDSLDEAVEWATRVPSAPGWETNLEVRQVTEDEDFGEGFTTELRETEARIRAKSAGNR
ncbi:YciI family protein [Actinocrispum sp. NPDC049592]|uniref:YciI family protein n=1 Tax=Actinocrispum sp. NPDC049592 TaxID=3154835 RepID=UPI00343E0AA2